MYLCGGHETGCRSDDVSPGDGFIYSLWSNQVSSDVMTQSEILLRFIYLGARDDVTPEISAFQLRRTRWQTSARQRSRRSLLSGFFFFFHLRNDCVFFVVFIFVFARFPNVSVGMATLVENRSYGLSGKLSRGGNVSVFHVKLTDSAARAIDLFRNGKVILWCCVLFFYIGF